MTATDTAMDQLGALAEFGMAAVRKLGVAIEAADDTRTLCDLVDAHCKVGRSVRQCIALRLRIASGSFDTAPRDAVERGDENRPEPKERGERADWNEYERPDWNVPIRLNSETFEEDLEAGVAIIRRSFAQGLRVLDRVQPGARASLLAGASHLRLVDSS